MTATQRAIEDAGPMKQDYMRNYSATWKKGDGTWIARTDFPGHPARGKDFVAKTEANARAKMLIYLIENGLIKI